VQIYFSTTAALALTVLLSACGGGGGDSAGTADAGAISEPGPVTNPATGPAGPEPDNGVASVTSVTLAPLPSPPLTEAPSSNDEPLPQDPVFNTITDFQVVAEPSPRVDKEALPDLTEADFAAGLPEAVITVPAGVNTTENGAPFFEDLSNVRVEAGAIVEIRFAPRDPEGGLPGMFNQELPEGATFDDNFDGSKSLVWQTFQADIGVTAFTVVAIDPEESQYRSSQTVLIAVDEPSDPSSVPNIAPSIQPVPDYTVRVGDPAAILIDGFDRNGTQPTIELVDPPAGTTLTPDERDPDLNLAWLRVVPTTVGTLVLDVLTRDADNAALTGLDQITLNVRAAADFARPGARLRNAAEGTGLLFGSALSPVFYLQADGGIYEAFASTEFALMTPESSMKWDAINPLPGLFQFSDMDNLMQFAARNDMLVRGHPLVWHRSLPPWVEETAVADREVHMREFITRVMNRYSDRVEYWDVINEPMSEANDGSMRESLWYEAMGESYIDTAFLQARELDPTAKLVLNEFDIGFSGPKFDGLLALVDRMLERNVPVDAVGFQMHVFSSFNQFDELAANMAAIAARGLDIHITEFDVALVDGDNEVTQAEVYSRVVEICQAQPRCTVLQTWGFTDRYSFRTFQDPLYLDRDHQAKPAYQALQEALGSN